MKILKCNAGAKTNFQKIGGIISIDSKNQIGTTIEIRLPLTLTIMYALIVSIKDFYFAVPQFNISEVLWLYGEDVYQKIQKVNEQEVFSLRGKLIPIISLKNILKIEQVYYNQETNERMPERRIYISNQIKVSSKKYYIKKGLASNQRRFSMNNSLYILILKLGNIQYGLVVDNIIDTEEIVVKAMHKQLERCHAFAGTTILGDGKIALILDITNISELATFKIKNMEYKEPKKKVSVEDKQPVILFDIGGKEVFAVPLILIRHIELIKSNDIMIASNREYLHLQEKIIPLVHLEDALYSVNSSYGEAFYVIIIKAKKPIGILASRIIDTRIIKSSFDTKTVKRKGVFGVKVIQEKLTLILDVYKIIEMVYPNWFKYPKQAWANVKKILLIEDAEFYSTLIKSFLIGTGIEVVTAYNGKQGIQALRKNKFDFIISDLLMPEMNGFEFAKYIKAKQAFKDIPLIALSAIEEKTGREMAKEAGFNDYISKLNREALIDSLKKLSTLKTKI